MAGIKQFDEREALRGLMRVFWRKGYGAASIDDLTAETGLRRGSLYNAFGDKDAMYRSALECYWEEVSAPVRDALSDPDPVLAIRKMLDANIARMADPSNPRGCLSTHAALDLAAREDWLGELVRGSHAAYRARIRGALERARDQGRIAAAADLDALANFFHGVVRGMVTMHRAYGDMAAVRDMADVAMRVLKSD